MLESAAVEEASEVTAASRSRLGIVATVTAAVLGVVAGVAGFGWWRATRPVELPLIRFSAQVALGRNSAGVDPVMRLARSQPGGLLALSPDGTRITSGIVDRDGKIRLAVRSFDQSQFVPIPGTENPVSPFFSPDGQWVGFFADGKLKKVRAQGGAPMILSDSGLLPSGSWGEDGNIIATLNKEGGLSLVPSGGGLPMPVTELRKGETVHRFPQVLPGAQAVMFTVYTNESAEDGTIEVLSFKNRERKILVRGGEMGRYVATSNASGHLIYLHQTELLAVPFDLGSLALTGTPQPVLSDVNQYSYRGFDVSKTGMFVYISGDEEPPYAIFWLDSIGTTKSLHAAAGFYSGLRFSPDGLRLAFASGSVPQGQEDLWVQDLDRDTSVRLSSLPGTKQSPVWTPDGKYIVFDSDNQPNAGIYWTRADGSSEPQRLAELGSARVPASFSPGGKRLAVFDIGRGFETDIWTASIVGDPDHPRLGKREPFLHTPPGPAELPTFAMPAFSPDGRWIAYCSGETGESEVYVNGFPNGEKRRISNSGGEFPIWSPNGHELFFVGSDRRINVVDYTTKGDSFLPTKPRQWSQQQILFKVGGGPYQPYDLAPDGKRFAVILYPNGKAEKRNSVQLTFLLNFFDELRRRAPVGK
jgi:serine/threonine-protein kinase